MSAREGRTFLVTGAAGFVGSHLVSALTAKYGPSSVVALASQHPRPTEAVRIHQMRQQDIRVLQCDLLELPKLNLRPPRFDVLYHLAAHVETERASPQMTVNTHGTKNLLDWLAERLKGTHILYTGTLASVDPKPGQGPIVESTPCNPVTDYGRTKLEAERIIRARSVALGLPYTILRLPTIIGRGFRSGGMFEIFPRLLRRRALATRLDWPGRTSFLSISDLVEILIEVPQVAGARNQLYILSNGEGLTFDQFLDQLAHTLGVRRDRVVMPKGFWRSLGAVAVFAASKRPLPHRLRTFCWRVSLMVYDGLHADASELNRILPRSYRSIREALEETYRAESPVAPCGR